MLIKAMKNHCSRGASPPHPSDAGYWCGTVESEKQANIGDMAQNAAEKNREKHWNIIKMDAKIDARTTKNHQELKFAFWQFFGMPFSPNHRMIWSNLGSIFRRKSKKGIQKRMHKSMPKEYHKMMPNWAESDAKRHQQWIPKSTFYRKADFSKTMLLP